MTSTASNRCCCDCTGMGLPIFTDWKINRGAWANGSIYNVGDLVFSGSPAAYYVCKQDHYAFGSAVQPPNTTYWTVADRALKCLYVQTANIGLKDCIPLVGIEDGEDPTATGARNRLALANVQIADKWLLRQRNPYPDENGNQNTYLAYYGDMLGSACWWQHNCDCDGDVYTERVTVQTQVGPITVWTDSYSSPFIIHIAFTPTPPKVEVVIIGSFTPMSSGADGEYAPDKLTDTPCVHPTLWIGTYTEYFRGSASIPANWIDAYGVPTSDIVIANQHSCADIGTILDPGAVPTGHYLPIGRSIIAGGGGTVTLTAPFAVGWQDTIGNAAVSCGAIPPCDAGDPPEPPPPYPPLPPIPPCPFPPCGPGPGPTPRPDPPPPPRGRRWRPVNKCSGGFYGKWVDSSVYAAGEVLRVQNASGDPVCVVIGGGLKIAPSPPGPLLNPADILNVLGPRACAECDACWKLVGCPGSTMGTVFTDVDLSSWEDQVVEVLYIEATGELDPPQCATISSVPNCPQTQFVIIGATLDNCNDPACTTLCYTLTNCNTSTTVETDTDLSAYEGSVILWNEACWNVSAGHPCGGGPYESVEGFTTQDSCLDPDCPGCCTCGDCEFSDASEAEWYDQVTTRTWENKDCTGSYTDLVVTVSGTLTRTLGYCGLYQGTCTVTYSDGRPDSTVDVGWWFGCSSGYWDPHPGSLLDEFCIPGTFADYQNCEGFDPPEVDCGCNLSSGVQQFRTWRLAIKKNTACE